MTGRYHADRVQLANVNSTTMANIVANVLNKVVVNEFQTYPRWWAPIVRTEKFTTLQTVKWITLGGRRRAAGRGRRRGLHRADLGRRGRDGATWQKRGGYLGITLEAMDKDDVGRLRNAPRALAQAAWLTLGKAIAGIFTQALGRRARPWRTASRCSTQRPRQPGHHGALERHLGGGQAGHAQADRAQLGRAAGRADRAEVPARAAGPGGHGADRAGVRGHAGHGEQRRQRGGRGQHATTPAWRPPGGASSWSTCGPTRTTGRRWRTPGCTRRSGWASATARRPRSSRWPRPTSGLMFSNDVMPIKVRWFYRRRADGLPGAVQGERRLSGSGGDVTGRTQALK